MVVSCMVTLYHIWYLGCIMYGDVCFVFFFNSIAKILLNLWKTIKKERLSNANDIDEKSIRCIKFKIPTLQIISIIINLTFDLQLKHVQLLHISTIKSIRHASDFSYSIKIPILVSAFSYHLSDGQIEFTKYLHVSK